MTRSLLPLTLLLFCTACALSSSPRPTGTPRATERGVAGFGVNIRDVQSTPTISENQALSTVTPIPTFDAEKAQMLDDIKAANDRAQRALDELNAQQVEIANAYKAAAESNERTSENNKGTAQIEKDKQAEITKQMEQANEEKRLLIELAKAQAEKQEAQARLILAVCVVAVTSSLCLLAARALARHPAQKITVVTGEAVMRPTVPISPTGDSVRPLPVDPELMYRFVSWGVQGQPLGTNSLESNQVMKSTERNERSKIITYLQNLNHLAYSNGAVVLSDVAVSYWTDWMSKYRPAPLAEVAETVAYTRHEYDKHAHVAAEITEGGRVVDDHFGIAPETEHHRPQAETYYAALEPKKEQE